MSPLTQFVAVALLLSGQHPQMPVGMSHEEHLKQMKEEAVTVKDQADEKTVAAIRSHLRSIASEFSEGRFDKPFQTHGEVPPGAVDLQTKRAQIAYRYEDMPEGGAVRIETSDVQARDAVHAFLRYQISEHHTGDSLEYRK